MAKKALINREAKRVALAKKYAAKRAAIFAVINDSSATDEERFEARLKLQAIPRNAAPVRQRVAVLSPVVRVVPSVNSAWAVSRSVKLPCVAKSRV